MVVDRKLVGRMFVDRKGEGCHMVGVHNDESSMSSMYSKGHELLGSPGQ